MPPSKYKSEYCDKLRKFFDRKPYTEELITDKDGATVLDRNGKPVKIIKPCDFPLLNSFLCEIEVLKPTAQGWRDIHPDFAKAWAFAKMKQEEILVTNGLLKLYDPTSWIFASKNIIGYRNEESIKHSGHVSIEKLMEKVSKKNGDKDFVSD